MALESLLFYHCRTGVKRVGARFIAALNLQSYIDDFVSAPVLPQSHSPFQQGIMQYNTLHMTAVIIPYFGGYSARTMKDFWESCAN